MCGQEKQPLHERQTATEWAVREIEHLNGSARPPLTLDQQGVDAFRRQAECQSLAQIARDVALAQQGQGQQNVFGDRLGRQSVADGAERGAARDRIGAAAERGIPGVAARHDGVEEEALLVRQGLAQCQVGLHRIVIVEGVRDLHDPDRGFGKEADRAHEEVALRHEIGVEYGDEVGIGLGQCVVDVAGLAVSVVGPGEIADPFAIAESLQPWRVVHRPEPRR